MAPEQLVIFNHFRWRPPTASSSASQHLRRSSSTPSRPAHDGPTSVTPSPTPYAYGSPTNPSSSPYVSAAAGRWSPGPDASGQARSHARAATPSHDVSTRTGPTSKTGTAWPGSPWSPSRYGAPWHSALHVPVFWNAPTDGPRSRSGPWF